MRGDALEAARERLGSGMTEHIYSIHDPRPTSAEDTCSVMHAQNQELYQQARPPAHPQGTLRVSGATPATAGPNPRLELPTRQSVERSQVRGRNVALGTASQGEASAERCRERTSQQASCLRQQAGGAGAGGQAC